MRVRDDQTRDSIALPAAARIAAFGLTAIRLVAVLVALLGLWGAPVLEAGEDRAYDLDHVVQETGTRLQWDPYREIGTLWNGRTSVSFRPGSSVVLEDYRTEHRIAGIERHNGSLRFSAEAVESFKSIFATPEPSEDGPTVGAIFVDPGHGGKDPGTIGRHEIDGELFEIHEKDIVLDIAHHLVGLLKRRYGDREIVMSRSDDTYLTLEQRTEAANSVPIRDGEVILFVSVHANASLNSRASGFEVWYLSPEVPRDGLVTQASAGVNDPQLLSLLNTIRDEELTIESILLAQSVLEGLDSRVGAFTGNRGIKKESWYVVREAKMPSILVEVGFVTNKEEALLLADGEYLNKLAHGIYNGVNNFIEDFERRE